MTISSSIPNLLSASSALDSHGTSKTEAFSEVFTSWLSKTSRIWVHPFFESLLRKRPSIKSWLHLGRKILPYDGIVVKKTPRLAKIDCLKFLLTKLAQINFKQHYHLKDRAQAFMMGGHLRHGSVLKPHISNAVYNNDVMHDAVNKFLRRYFVPTGVITEGPISSVYNVSGEKFTYLAKKTEADRVLNLLISNPPTKKNIWEFVRSPMGQKLIECGLIHASKKPLGIDFLKKEIYALKERKISNWLNKCTLPIANHHLFDEDIEFCDKQISKYKKSLNIRKNISAVDKLFTKNSPLFPEIKNILDKYKKSVPKKSSSDTPMEKAYLQATFPKNELDPVHRAMLVDFMEYFLVDNDLYTKLNKTSQEERRDKTKLDAIFTAGKPKLKSFADEDSEFYDIYCEAYQRLYGLKRTNFMERALKLIGVSAENQILTQHIELMLDEHPGIMKRLKNKKEPSEADKKRLDDYMRQKEAKFKQFSALKSDSVDNCLQLLYLLFSGPDLRRPGHEIKRPGSMSSLDHLNPFIFKQQYRPKFNSTVAEGIIHDHAFDRSLLQMALLPTYGMSFFSPTKTSPHRASTRAQLLIWPDEKKNQGAQLKVFEIGYDLNREVASIFHVNIKKQCAKMQSTETAISKSVEPFNLEAWNFPAILPTQLLDKDTYSKEQFANCLFKELAPKKPAGPLIHFDEHGNVSKINISSKVTLLTNRFFESRLRSFISNKLRKDSKELEKYKEAGTPLSDSIDAIMFHDKISRTFAKLTFQLSHFKDELKMIVTRHLKRLISETGSMAADQKQSALLSLADFKKDWIDKKDLADSIKILQSVIEKFL